jgi:hypothetical protein
MKEDLFKLIKSLQLKFDTNKMKLELDKEIQLFVKLLADYVEAWNIIFHWKNNPRPLVIVEPINFDFVKLKSKILPIVIKSHYIRGFAYSFFEQYAELETYNEKIVKINRFLKEALNQYLLELKNEYMLFCSECGKAIVTNRINEKERCSCGSLFDFKFYLASFPNKIIEEIVAGHLLEMYALYVMKTIKDIELIGMEIIDDKERCIYTSIEYVGVGVEDKVNGEIDLLGLIDTSLVVVECKFNKTTYTDIKDFMGISEKLLLKVKERFPNVKMYRIIFSYDGTKLKQNNTLLVVSLKNVSSTNDLVREINQWLR